MLRIACTRASKARAILKGLGTECESSGLFRGISRKRIHSRIGTSSWKCDAVGEEGTLDYRIHFKNAGEAPISPWHDIPLLSTSTEELTSSFLINYVNEIPKGTKAKLEIATEEAHNPIKQDVKKGRPRYYPWESLVNYGCLPQTWEDPLHLDTDTQCYGDNDPLDVIEIGDRLAFPGEIYQVRVLGILGLIDDGETDWKILGIRADDPQGESCRSLSAVERLWPGKLKALTAWFRDYKIPGGGKANKFAFDGEAKDHEYAMDIISQAHQHWKNLLEEPTRDKNLWRPGQ